MELKRKQYREAEYDMAGWKKARMAEKQTGFHKCVQSHTYY